MPTYSFGNNGGAGDRPTAFSDRYVYYDTATPAGRLCMNGHVPIAIPSGVVKVNGRGGARNLTPDFGGSGGPAFGIASAGSAISWYGFVLSAPHLMADGGAARRMTLTPSGSFYFNRNSGGPGTVYDGYATAFGGSLAGYFDYWQVASAPVAPVVTPASDGESASVLTSSSGVDNGGTALTGLRLQRALDIGFTSGVATIDTPGTSLVTGLTPGQGYYWRSTARNYVSDGVGATGGQWSPAVYVEQPDPALGRIRDATDSFWEELDGRIRSADNLSWLELDGRIRSADNLSWLQLG